MAKDVRSISSINRPVAAFVFAVLISTGCTRTAPELPPDYGSVNATAKLSADQFSRTDLVASCADIAGEKAMLVTRASGLTGVIRANRQHNQAVGYFGGLFLFPLVAARNNESEKQNLDRMQARWDTLEALKRLKACPSSTR